MTPQTNRWSLVRGPGSLDAWAPSPNTAALESAGIAAKDRGVDENGALRVDSAQGPTVIVVAYRETDQPDLRPLRSGEPLVNRLGTLDRRAPAELVVSFPYGEQVFPVPLVGLIVQLHSLELDLCVRRRRQTVAPLHGSIWATHDLRLTEHRIALDVSSDASTPLTRFSCAADFDPGVRWLSRDGVVLREAASAPRVRCGFPELAASAQARDGVEDSLVMIVRA